jgi:uncharacterized phage protein (TIGR01671 family)
VKVRGKMIPKFKVWDKNKQCIKDVDFTPKGISFDDVEFMQSTGLEDANGNEIFEADVLRNNAQEYIFLVRYDYDNCRWFGEGITINTRIDITRDVLKYYSKIGNRWESPELLKKEKRYKVKIKASGQYIMRDPDEDAIYFYSSKAYSKLTKKKLEQAGFGWVFDCKGIEIEEVVE